MAADNGSTALCARRRSSLVCRKELPLAPAGAVAELVLVRPTMAHTDLNALMNDLLPLAERLLAEHGEFYPFGATITSDGRHISIGAKTESNRPKSRELINIMTNAFRSDASEGKIRAAGICFDVHVVPPGQVDKTDAIQLALERENEAVDVFVPYTQLSDGTFTYGEMFASERTATLFLQPREKA